MEIVKLKPEDYTRLRYPHKFKYAAKDSDGEYFLYTHEPELLEYGFRDAVWYDYYDGILHLIPTPSREVGTLFRDSLRKIVWVT